MTIKDETTLMVKQLSTLPDDELPAFQAAACARFRAALQNHTQGPLDDPSNPDAVPEPGVDPRNIYLTLLMLDDTLLSAHLAGKFAAFINGKWLMALDVAARLLPLAAPAETLRQALAGVTLTQFLSADPAETAAAYASDCALLRDHFRDIYASDARRLHHLTQFAHL